MVMPIFYDRDGVPLADVLEWGKLHADLSYLRVARTKLTDAADPAVSVDVSTVGLGIDHGWGYGPLIFETMVFAEGSSLDEQMARYSTEAQARAGHTALVIEVATGMVDPIVIDVEDA